MMTPIELQLSRGSAADVAAYTGAQGEAVVDTTNSRLVVQDGTTAGGWPAARIADLPVINVALPPYNAVIDGTTNNSTAVQNAITALASSGGTVFFPPGTCVAYNLTVPAGVILAGAGGSQNASILSSGGADATVVTVNSSYSGLDSLRILGGGFGTTHPAVVLSGGDENTIRFCHITGGTSALYFNGASETVIEGCNITQGYGAAGIYCVNGGGYFIRCKIDQSWNGQFPGAGATITPWASGMSVTSGELVSLSGYLLHAQTAGSTGTTPPAIQNYGVLFADNTVTWRSRAPLAYYGVQCNNVSSLVAELCDFSGAHTAAIALTSTLSGQVPVNVQILNCTSTDFLNNALYLDAGAELVLIGNLIGDGHLAGSKALQFTSNWLGDVTIAGNTISGCDTGISIEGGKRCNITGNRIFGMSTAAIHVAPGVTDFTVVGNDVGGAYTGAPNAIGVLVDAGSSNNYTISLNNTDGATIGISDGGTGTSKFVDLNGGPMALTSLAPVAGNTIVANVGGSSAAPAAVTPAQLLSVLGLRQTNNPTAPAGITSLTRVMAGLAIAVTPQTSGNLLCFAQASFTQTSNDGASCVMMFGTGTAPSFGVAQTGTFVGQPQATNVAAATSGNGAVTCAGYTAGLTAGTTYWFDLGVKATGGGSVGLFNIQFTFIELKPQYVLVPARVLDAPGTFSSPNKKVT